MPPSGRVTRQISVQVSRSKWRAPCSAAKFLVGSLRLSALEESCERPCGGAIGDQFAEDLAKRAAIVVVAGQQGLRPGVMQCAFARRVAGCFVSIELFDGCSVSDYCDQSASEVEGVLHADVECGSSGVEDVRRIASEEDPAESVDVGLGKNGRRDRRHPWTAARL